MIHVSCHYQILYCAGMSCDSKPRAAATATAVDALLASVGAMTLSDRAIGSAVVESAAAPAAVASALPPPPSPPELLASVRASVAALLAIRGAWDWPRLLVSYVCQCYIILRSR